MVIRSWLFCPGDRPDRLGKAAAVADVVVTDLEDSVAPQDKGSAREAVAAWLRAAPSLAPRVWVRINNDGHRDADLAAVAGLGIAGVVLPKAEITTVRDVAGRVPVFALIETANGLWELPDLARIGGVAGLGLGEYDLAAELGAEVSGDGPLSWARARLVAAAAAAGLAPPPAPVSAELANTAGFRAETAALQRAGFFGRMCIHPAQVTLTHEVMVPAASEIADARAVLQAAEDTGVAVVAGRMVDAAVVRRARRILALATASTAE